MHPAGGAREAMVSLSRMFGGGAREFPLGYSASLDGARGLMTLGVLAAHLHYHWYPGAIIFMDTFFIMSSYLITSLLIKDRETTGTVNFRRFYERRIRRLLPALLAMLAVYTVAVLALGRPWLPEARAIAKTGYLDALSSEHRFAGSFWELNRWLLGIDASAASRPALQ